MAWYNVGEVISVSDDILSITPTGTSFEMDGETYDYGGNLLQLYYYYDDGNGLQNFATIHLNYIQPSPDADILLGDVNQDGSIDYLDAMQVLRYDAELVEFDEDQLAAGDVNDDGEVNSLDAILILRYDAGLIDSFE